MTVTTEYVQWVEDNLATLFPAQHATDVAARKAAARERRRATREAVDQAARSIAVQTFDQWADAAQTDVDDLEPLVQATPHRSEACLHCTRLASLTEKRRQVGHWRSEAARVASDPTEPIVTKRVWEPKVRMVEIEALDGTERWVLPEEDDDLPEFQPIYRPLAPKTEAKLVELASKPWHRVAEPAGDSQLPACTTAVGHKPSRAQMVVRKESRFIDADGRARYDIDFEITGPSVTSLLGKSQPKPERSYPGTYYIGHPKPGHEEYLGDYRTLVTTVWLERRRAYAIYVARVGPRDERGYETWVPYEWYLVPNGSEYRGQCVCAAFEDTGTCDHARDFDAVAADPECWTLERALDVAYMKAQALRSEWGISQMSSPLPFDPTRLSVIADAQAAELERKRRTMDHHSEDE